MKAIRRTDHEMRIEMMPLIDVIFLLLTFFIYAMVLMIRAELLPMDLPEYASAEPARPSPAITVSLDREGRLNVDREPVVVEDVLPRIRAAVDAEPATVVYLAAEAEGDLDRLPTFLDLYDRLANAGLDLRLVGKPKETPPSGAGTP